MLSILSDLKYGHAIYQFIYEDGKEATASLLSDELIYDGQYYITSKNICDIIHSQFEE